MQIRAILFDLDNTLTHRDLSVVAYSRHIALCYAMHLQPNQIAAITQIIRRIDNGGYPQKQYLTQPSIAASVAEAMLNELEWNKKPSLDELSQFWFQHFGYCAIEMPGAKQLLCQLKAEGYQLAVVSNGGHQTRINILQGLGMAQYFDVIHSSGLLGMKKPEPEIFQHTAQVLNCPIAQCLFVGDHPINDIQGATRAGMPSLWLSGFHDLPPDMQVRPIQHLQQVWQYLAA